MTKEELKEAVAEAIHDKLGEFYIERQKHYEHHQFIDGIITTSEKIKGTACKTITTSGIIGLLAILVVGFIAWIKQHLK